MKTHPRDPRNIYEENGFKVDKNSAIPWEVIQLSGDFSDKVFLTATSGSVLAGSFLSEKPTRTLYTYPLCDLSHHRVAQDSRAAIEELLGNESLRQILHNVEVIHSVEDIEV